VGFYRVLHNQSDQRRLVPLSDARDPAGGLGLGSQFQLWLEKDDRASLVQVQARVLCAQDQKQHMRATRFDGLIKLLQRAPPIRRRDGLGE